MGNRTGNITYNNFDYNTNVDFNTEDTTVWFDGTPMDDSKVDNAIYFKNRTPATGYAKRCYEGDIKARWYGLKGDKVTDDLAAFNYMMSKIPNGACVDFGNRTYYFSDVAIVTGKINVTFKGAATFIGRIQIGIDNGIGSVPFNFRIQDITFDHNTFPLTQNAISIINAKDIDIENVWFSRPNACVYIMPRVPVVGQPNTHVARVKFHNCHVFETIYNPDGSVISVNNRYCNYDVYVDNIDHVNPKFVIADCKIENNVQMFANICNVEAYGVDGLEMQHNTFFLPGGFYKSQIKTNNVKIVVANWSRVNDNNVFEAGEAGIWVDRFQNGTICDNNIAWPGQKDQTKGYGILITGLGYQDTSYNDITVVGNIVNIPSRAGIWVESNGVIVDATIVKAPGNGSRYYGDGTHEQGDPNATPLLDQSIVSAGGYLNTCYDIQFINNQCSEKNWLFPVNEAIAETKRPVNLFNRQTGSLVEFTSGSATTIVSNTIDVSNLSEIILALPSNSSIATITGGNIGQIVTLYNGGNNVTITNSSTLILKGFIDVVIPFRGSVTIRRRSSGVWKEIARAMAEETVLTPQLVSDLNAVTRTFAFWYSTVGAANSPVAGSAQGIQFAAQNDPNFKMELIMTGTPSLFVRSSNTGVWGPTYRMEYKGIYNVRTGGTYFPNFQNEIIEVTADNTDISLSQDVTTISGVVKIFKNSSNTVLTVTPNTSVTINGNTGGAGQQTIPVGGRLEIVASAANTWRIVTLTAASTTAIVDTTTTGYTKATLNTAYPNAKIGQMVIADLITTGGLMYTKKDNSSTGNWVISPISTLT